MDILHLSIRILLSWLISGSFGISGTELATIASLLLPITIILFNNGSSGWMKMLQRLYYDKWYLGFDFTNTMDTTGIAEASGLRGVRIPDPDRLSPVMTEALASNEPVFIDIPTKLITPGAGILHAKGLLLGVGGSIPRISRHVTSTCSFDKNRSTIKQGRISTTSF